MKYKIAILNILLAVAVFVGTSIVVLDVPQVNAQQQNPCGDFEQQGPLCVPKNPFEGSNNSLVAQTTATGLIATIIRLMLYFAGMIAVVFVIIGGYYYLTARGNEEQATKGRQSLIYALLGLSIVILSYVIVNVLTNQLTNGS